MSLGSKKDPMKSQLAPQPKSIPKWHKETKITKQSDRVIVPFTDSRNLLVIAKIHKTHFRNPLSAPLNDVIHLDSTFVAPKQTKLRVLGQRHTRYIPERGCNRKLAHASLEVSISAIEPIVTLPLSPNTQDKENHLSKDAQQWLKAAMLKSSYA